MSRILVHMACPNAKRALAATMDGLSGLTEEHSVRLTAVPSGASDLWDTEHGYNGIWWGASQPFAASVAQAMLASGFGLGTESWFVAYDETTGTLLQHNLPAPPANVTFDAFIAAAGLSR